MSSHAVLKRRLVRLAVAAMVVGQAACTVPEPEAAPPQAASAEAAPSNEAPAQHARSGRYMPVSSAAGRYLAGRLAQSQGDLTMAAHYYAYALSADPQNVDLLSRAFAMAAADGRMELAAELGRQLLIADPEASLAAFALAGQAAKQDDWAAVEKLVGKLSKRGLNSFMVPLITAWARAGQGRTDQALVALEPLASNSQFAAVHQFHTALINDLAGRSKAAEDAYRQVVAGNGALSLRAVQAATSFYLRHNQPAKAQELVDLYRRQFPDSGLLEVSAEPAVANARQGLAEAFFGGAGSVRSQSSDLALVFSWLTLDLRPDLVLAQMQVADVLQGRGKLAEANRLFAAIDPKSEVWWVAQLRLAENQDEMGEDEAAVATLERLASQRPDRSDPLVALGEIHRKHKRFPEAVSAYDRALARLPELDGRHWALLYSRGIALERAGDWIRAETDLLRALELEPDQPLALNYLGYTWVEKGTNLDKARAMLEKAVTLRPEDGGIVDSLGWALYRMGQFDESVKVLDRAIVLQPEDPTINDHLGDALWQVGRLEEARYQWQRALLLKPEPDDAEGIQTKIKDGLKTAAGSP